MKKDKRWIYVLGFLLILLLIISLIIYYVLNTNLEEIPNKDIFDGSESSDSTDEHNIIDWINFDPFDMISLEEIISITYIKDRSNIGEDTNLSWYTEDKDDIQAILDSINKDISFVGYANDMNMIVGDSNIVVLIEMTDSTSHRLTVSTNRLTYKDTSYEIVSVNKFLMDAWKNIFRGQEATQIIGTDKP